ncbi:MAG: glucose-phosphatase [Patescibacteria group bacterium]|nr:glucose-phosphatase [Patescibacteria group bacterium]
MNSKAEDSTIDTIFFDWGGVIAGDPGDDFLGLLLRSIGATEAQVEEILDTYKISFMKGEISEAEYWDNLKRHYGFSIHDTISDEFKKWRGLEVNDQVLALVEQTKSKGMRAALLTNVIEPTYNVLNAAHLYDHFDVVIASCKVGLAKPQNEIYQLALDLLKTTPEKSLFIDDKQKNLDPAKAMGFRTILAQNPEQIIRDVNNYF